MSIFTTNLNTITTNRINKGKPYIAMASFPGDTYPKSVKTLIKEGKITQLAKAADPDNLLGKYFGIKYRVTPEGIYVNPWLEDDDKKFWLQQKNIIRILFADRIPKAELYWICQDLKVLPYFQGQLIFDIVERNFRHDDINLVMFFSAPGYAPILKLYGDGTVDSDGDLIVTKANVWPNDEERFKFGEKIEKLMKGWKIPSKLDDPNLGDWYTPEIKTDEQRMYEHIRGLDLEPTLEFDMEREFARASRDASEYTWSNLGWALARSANSFRCGGPKVEEEYSLEFFEILEDAPDTAVEFFHWLNIEWGNNYYHISPDQQALWEVVREFDDYATEKEKNVQFQTFINWILNWERAIPHTVEVDGKPEKRGIWSYKAEPMYGPKSRAYKLVDGEIQGNVVFTSLESYMASENDDIDIVDPEEYPDPESGTLAFYEEDDLDF